MTPAPTGVGGNGLVTDAYDLDAVSQLGLYGGVKWDPIAFNVIDPQSPDAPLLWGGS